MVEGLESRFPVFGQVMEKNSLFSAIILKLLPRLNPRVRSVVLITLPHLCRPHVAEQLGAHWRGPDGNAVAADDNPPVRLNRLGNLREARVPGRYGFGVRRSFFEVIGIMFVSARSGLRTVPTPTARISFYLLRRNREEMRGDASRPRDSRAPGTHRTIGSPRASPVTDGKHVLHFVSVREGCTVYTMGTRVLVWKAYRFPPMNGHATVFGEGKFPNALRRIYLVLHGNHEGQIDTLCSTKPTRIGLKSIGTEPTKLGHAVDRDQRRKRQIITTANGTHGVNVFSKRSRAVAVRRSNPTPRRFPVASK